MKDPSGLPITEYRLTDHVQLQMRRRSISEAEIAKVLLEPEQTAMVRTGRTVCQAMVEFGEPPRIGLLRIFIDVDRDPPEVVTVYRTSKIEKYWRNET